MNNLKKIDTAAKIRLLIFALIILWGAYLSVYYSWKIYGYYSQFLRNNRK